MDVVIPTFVNVHLFWIIPKKDIILRSAMEKLMSCNNCRLIDKCTEDYQGQMICLNIDSVWARGILESIVTTHNETKYVCWLPDYAIRRSVGRIYHLPESLQECPPIGKKASLYNVVNMTTDLILGATGYEFKLTKTAEDVEGVKKTAINLLHSAEKILFSFIKEDFDILYGDIICVQADNTRHSLTDSLIREKLIAVDEDMFKSVEKKRIQFRENFFQNSSSWNQPVDITQKELSHIIFNKRKSVEMDFLNKFQ